MLHWSPPLTAQAGQGLPSEPAEDAPFAQRLVARVVTHLGDTFRHLQRQASIRATSSGWEEDASARTASDVWVPCPLCQGAGMDRVTVPVPHDVFECPACHAVVTDAHGVTFNTSATRSSRVDGPTVDHDSWWIDDPRR